MQQSVLIRPQPGPQEKFLATGADICIYGGSAGGGKSYGLLLTPLRYKDVPGFTCTIFRKNYNQIFAQGGLWDEAESIYSQIEGAEKRNMEGAWNFRDKKTGSVCGRVKFAHLDREDAVHNWQGSQIAEICCEETTPVLMADGSYKAIRDLRIGDVVETLNGPSPVTAIGKRRFEECVEVTLPNGNSQIQTTNHKFLTDKGWISYEDTTVIQQDKNDTDSESILSCSELRCDEFEKPAYE